MTSVLVTANSVPSVPVTGKDAGGNASTLEVPALCIAALLSGGIITNGSMVATSVPGKDAGGNSSNLFVPVVARVNQSGTPS